MSDEKIWVQGLFAKRKNFDNGGSIQKNYIPNVDEYCAWLQANKKQDGSLSYNVSGSREPRLDDKGVEKLNASLDTWESTAQPQQASAQQFGAPQFGQQPQQESNNIMINDTSHAHAVHNQSFPQAPQQYAPSTPEPQFTQPATQHTPSYPQADAPPLIVGYSQVDGSPIYSS